MTTYHRIKVNVRGGARMFYGKNFRMNDEGAFAFEAVRRDGDGTALNGPHYVVGKGADLVYIKPARMNLTYGTIEVIK